MTELTVSKQEPALHHTDSGSAGLDHAFGTSFELDLGDIDFQDSDIDLDIPNAKKLGTFLGVVTPVHLNILGTILFLRLGWAVGIAGTWFASLIMLLCVACTFFTTLSMSAIATNGRVAGGGAYYMISRSLGPEFGGAIGLVFFFANAVSIALYVIGFAEALVDITGSLTNTSLTNDYRLVGAITMVIILVISLFGIGFLMKISVGLLVILFIAILSFIIGAFTYTGDVEGLSQFNSTMLNNNTSPHWSLHSDGASAVTTFAVVLGTVFPAVTGIMAGSNLSGDLKSPSKAIPSGTLWSILVTTLLYLLLIWFLGAVGTAEKLFSDKLVMVRISLWGPLVQAGVIAATISSALQALNGAPRVLQQLAIDRIFPFLRIFGQGRAKDNNPTYALIISFIVGCIFVAVGDINAIAPLISNFFLLSYGLVGYAVFVAKSNDSPSFRPTFKYFNRWISLAGSLICVFYMFLISVSTALLSFVILLIIYIYVRNTVKDIDWGDATRAQMQKSAVSSIYHLSALSQMNNVKLFRPHVVVLSGSLAGRCHLANFGSDISSAGYGLCVLGNVLVKHPPGKPWEEMIQPRNLYLQDAAHIIRERDLHACAEAAIASSMRLGVRNLITLGGVSQLRPNMAVIGFRERWSRTKPTDTEKLHEYVGVIHDLHKLEMGVMIGRRLDNLYGCTMSPGWESPLPPNARIDVYWLTNDGGTTLLVPFLLTRAPGFQRVRLRVITFADPDRSGKMRDLLENFRIPAEVIELPSHRLRCVTDVHDISHLKDTDIGITIGHGTHSGTVMPTLSSLALQDERKKTAFDLFKLPPDPLQPDQPDHSDQPDTVDPEEVHVTISPEAEVHISEADSDYEEDSDVSKDNPEIHTVDDSPIRFEDSLGQATVESEAHSIPLGVDATDDISSVAEELANLNLSKTRLQELAKRTNQELVSGCEEWLHTVCPDELRKRTASFIRLMTIIREYSSDASLVFVSSPMPRSTVPPRLYMAWLELLSSIPRTPVVLIRGSQDVLSVDC